MLRVGPDWLIPDEALSYKAVHSGGPGGQNVNKVATRVELLLDLEQATELIGPEAAQKLRQRLRGRIDREGRVRVVSCRFREQSRNVADAVERLEQLLRQALEEPKQRRATKPTAASRQRRLEQKRRRSQIKRLRAERLTPDEDH